jgi:hypothetical protein
MNSATTLTTSHTTKGLGELQGSNHELCHHAGDVTHHERPWDELPEKKREQLSTPADRVKYVAENSMVLGFQLCFCFCTLEDSWIPQLLGLKQACM